MSFSIKKMGYSIKHTHVTLTTEQFRALIATLEAVRDADSLEWAKHVSVTSLEGLEQQGLVSAPDADLIFASTRAAHGIGARLSPCANPTECGLVFVNDFREQAIPAGTVTDFHYRTDMLWKVRDGVGFEVRRIWADSLLIFGEGTIAPVNGVRVFYGDQSERIVFANDRIPSSALRPAQTTDEVRVAKEPLDVLIPVEIPIGACHIALIDYDLSPHGNRIPIITAECVYQDSEGG